MVQSTSLEMSYKELLHYLDLKVVTQVMDSQRTPQFRQLHAIKAYIIKHLIRKIDPSQNMYQSTPLERSCKQLLNALFRFESDH